MQLGRLRGKSTQLYQRIRPRYLHATAHLQRELFNPNSVERAEDEVDVCIVGGGPAGLSAAIRLKQLEQEKGREIRVVVLEKGSEIGKCKAMHVIGQFNNLTRRRCTYPFWRRY